MKLMKQMKKFSIRLLNLLPARKKNTAEIKLNLLTAKPATKHSAGPKAWPSMKRNILNIKARNIQGPAKIKKVRDVKTISGAKFVTKSLAKNCP